MCACFHRELNDSYLEGELGIKYMDIGLEEYYANDRKMRKGEVGCFLSHYTIWKKVRSNVYCNITKVYKWGKWGIKGLMARPLCSLPFNYTISYCSTSHFDIDCSVACSDVARESVYYSSDGR